MNLVECWALPNGTPLTLRPVCANDAPALNDLIEGLPRQDLRWRFHGAVTGVSPERLQAMTRVDASRELALVVAAPSPFGEQVVADVRCVVDRTGEAAEFALMVAPSWRRRGIGRRALAALRHAATQRGLHWLYGSVLADNAPMLSLLQRCGFSCMPNRNDRALVATEAMLRPVMLAGARHA